MSHQTAKQRHVITRPRQEAESRPISPITSNNDLTLKIMKMFLAMLGSVVLAGAAVAFRSAAPSTVMRASTVAFASASEFAKSEIASSDVSVNFCHRLIH